MQIVLPTADDLQKKLDVTRHQLALISEVSTELVGELDFHKLLDLVAHKACEIIDAETLLIPVIQADRQKYTYYTAVGKNAPYIRNQTFPVHVGMCGWVLTHKEPLIFAKDIPWLMDEKTQWEEGMESALLVPLLARGEMVGGLSALGKVGGESFTKDDLKLLQLFANQVSVAIDNARIFKELTEEKERAEVTLNSIGDAVVATDVGGRIVRANAVASNLLGLPVSKLIGRLLKDVFIIRNAESGEVVEDPVEKVMASGEIVGLANHTVLTRSDGQEFQIADSAAPIRGVDGALLGVILVFHDVSEEYALLNELRASEQKHRRLVEHLGSEFFMYIQEPSGHFNYISPSIKASLGYTPEDFIENHWSYITDNVINKDAKDAFKTSLLGKIPKPYLIEVVNKQGENCYLRVSTTPVLNEHKEVIALEGLVQNVTEQRALEEAVRQSQKMEAIGQLSGGIAHDFNNQLGIVMGYLDMLDETIATGTDQHHWVQTAVKSTQRCVELTQSLMHFSRKKIIQKKSLNLNDCIMSMHSMLEKSLTALVQLNIHLDSDLSRVLADEGEFQDVVLNLIINARDSMQQSQSARVVVETKNVVLESERKMLSGVLAAGAYVTLSVTDNGEGMDGQTQQRIFEPFFTTKPAGSGTGLGMAMVFGFISRVKGAIEIKSQPGVGTKIELYIPEGLKNQSETVTDDFSDFKELPRGDESILLVEDEQALRDLAESYLRGLGYTLHLASDAAEALEILKSPVNIDMLFSDVIMPGDLDGFALAEQTRHIRPDICILMATGYASHSKLIDNKTEGEEAVVSDTARDGTTRGHTTRDHTNNADEVLYKPYSRSILAQRVRRMLDQNKQ